MPDVITPDALSTLIGAIYDAAIDPESWVRALEEIRVALNCENSALMLQALPTGTVLLNITTNIPDIFAEQLVKYGTQALDIWGGREVLFSLPMNQPAVLSRVNPAAMRFDETENPYTLEWARPQGLVDLIAFGLARDRFAIGSVGFGRHERHGPIGTREIAIARLLIPHLQRATTINRLLDLSTLSISSFEQLLNSVTVPVLLLTKALRPSFMNSAARELLDRGNLLHIQNGALSTVSIGATAALVSAVEIAHRDASRIGSKGHGIPVRRPDSTVALLHLLPMRSTRLNIESDTVAALFVAEPLSKPTPPNELIASLFGFTPAEARIFQRISSGLSVAETADLLDVEVSTVRTHLLRLFEKTGVRRQTDLIKIAESLTLPIN